jgi:hypothetical protein
MDREPVEGHFGTVAGMNNAAARRYDHYIFRTGHVPPAELSNALSFSKNLETQGRVDFDRYGHMPENQMGAFHYVQTAWDGFVELNKNLALIATRIGEAFTYATLIHEGGHALARAQGRLSPERVIDGELEAYRIQYRWITLIDPSAERMIVLHSTLRLRLKHHPEDRITALAITYLEHLLELYDTGGEELKLSAMIKRLGYREGHNEGANVDSPRA